MNISRGEAASAIIEKTLSDRSKSTAWEQKNAEKAVETLTIHNKGLSEFYDLRKEWSGALMGWVSAFIWFNILFTLAVTFFVGWRKLTGFNFDDMQWFIGAVIAEPFLQIIGLGYVAVHFLFSDSQIDRLRRLTETMQKK